MLWAKRLEFLHIDETERMQEGSICFIIKKLLEHVRFHPLDMCVGRCGLFQYVNSTNGYIFQTIFSISI